MSLAVKLPDLMTIDEFLKWPGDGTGTRYELVDGELARGGRGGRAVELARAGALLAGAQHPQADEHHGGNHDDHRQDAVLVHAIWIPWYAPPDARSLTE